MKKLISFVSAILFVSIYSTAQININCSGYVGIGTSVQTAYPLTSIYPIKFYNSASGASSLIIDGSYYYGLSFYPSLNNYCSLGKSGNYFSDIYCNTTHWGSDKRIKENIRAIKNPLEIIKNLNGVKFDFIKKYVYSDSIKYNPKSIEKIEKDRKDRLGFIAQDVQKILPEAVFYDDSLDFYSMDYIRIIPVLVEAMKEQQIIIEELNKRINNVQSGSNNLKRAQITTITENVDTNSDIKLFQNIPNPFTQITVINYFLPEEIKKAMICIYDLNGLQIKCIPINDYGRSSISISANELKAGMYIYSMIVDGQLIDSKRMVLTD